MEAEGHGSTQSTDSYIGSLISLTSKSEIRYEGVLFNINTEESSIGLRNVRSFGTEGRKKDGLQIPASDKIYEYILFRGSDIKDLQVKSSPPIYPMVPANHDTAIIQSQYSQPASTSTSITYNANASANDLGLQNSVLGLSRSTFETGYHSLQAGENLSSWGAFPATSSTNNSGLAIPMYWKGFNGYSTGVPSAIHQNPENPLVAQNLTSTRNSNSLPENPLVAQNLTSTRNSNSLPFPSIFPQEQATSFTSGPSLTSLQTKTSTISLSSTNQSASMQSFLPITNFEMNTTSLSTSISPTFVSVPPLPHQVVHPISNAVLSTTTTCHIESPSPITPDQLLPPVQGSSHSLFQSLKTENDVNVTQPLSSEFNNLISSKDLPSVLPLPTQTSYQRSTTTAFTEDFDFAAMNEKFNKDELWGHLGKDKEKVGKVDGPDNFLYEDHDVNSDHGAKLVYVKDDFFDSLSCNADQARGGRTRFSQQMKIDTETFGDISRKYRGNRGRCWVGSSGGHHRGSYHGRGGYGYIGRGRGRYV